MEQRIDVMREIGAVFCQALLGFIPELLAPENAGVFREQAEQQAHQIQFQRMPFITYRFIWSCSLPMRSAALMLTDPVPEFCGFGNRQ
ncbi:MAG: hypothetical protein R3E67_01655 [Pseudomonadales bacterium]